MTISVKTEAKREIYCIKQMVLFRLQRDFAVRAQYCNVECSTLHMTSAGEAVVTGHA